MVLNRKISPDSQLTGVNDNIQAVPYFVQIFFEVGEVLARAIFLFIVSVVKSISQIGKLPQDFVHDFCSLTLRAHDDSETVALCK